MALEFPLVNDATLMIVTDYQSVVSLYCLIGDL